MELQNTIMMLITFACIAHITKRNIHSQFSGYLTGKCIVNMIFCSCLFYSTFSPAQSTTDTLAIVRKYKSENNLKPATLLISHYVSSHPKDVGAIWLYAQLVFWEKDFKLSNKLFQKAIQLQPTNSDLQIDYASLLIENGELIKANTILNTYRKNSIEYKEAWYQSAKLAFWENDFSLAQHYIKTALLLEPKNTRFTALSDEIQNGKSSWINFSITGSSDNQPLQSLTPNLSAGIYKTRLLSPWVNYQSPLFYENSTNFNAQKIIIGNSFLFPKNRININSDGGIYISPFHQQTLLIGDLQIQKTISRYLELKASIGQRNYTNTISSIDTLVKENYGAISLGRNNVSVWMWQIGGEQNYFSFDKNVVNSAYFWITTKPFQFSRFSLRAGYRFNYSNSDKDYFTAKKTVSEIAADYDITSKIDGWYNPYFTPKNQQIHSLLISLKYLPSKIIELGANINAGVFASASIPYLTLNKDANNTLYINKNYSPEHYFPLDGNVYISIASTKNTSFIVDYKYSQTYFYHSHLLNIGVKIKLNHGK